MNKAYDQKLKLSDKRVLGYAESGDPKGSPIFLFHGLNSSRLEANIVHKKMQQAGLRCIGVDRPGMGFSTFVPNRKILDFVDDVTALADSLNIEKFSVMAISAGTPYALACTYKIPDRILFCGIISGVAPVFRFGIEKMSKESRAFIFLAKTLPWLVRYVFWFLHGRLSQNKIKEEQFLNNIMFTLDNVDKKLINNENARDALLQTFRESYIQGSKGVACDGILVFTKPWGFSLEEIHFTPIYLWHGEKDNAVPICLAESMAAKIDGAKLKKYPQEGHLSIVFNEMDDVIQDFKERLLL